MEIIREEIIKKSRKRHNCDGVNQLESNIDENDENHKTAWDQYKNCRGIKKGDGYYKQVQREDGELREFKSCLGCNKQLTKFNFFEENY